MSMAIDLSRCLDACSIATDCGLELDPWQENLLREQPRRALLCCSRQSGKSTVSALLALWTALYEPGALVLLVSPSQRQSAELFRTTIGFYHQLKNVPTLAAESVLRAEFSNGSRIVSLPGNETTVRGFSAASLVVLDEASRTADALISAIRPMLAVSDGKLIALSTPAGRRGWYYESWVGDGDWVRVRVPASECPRISKEFLEEELAALGPQRYSEEYELAFLDADTSVFPSLVIAAAFSESVRPLWL
jgi:hypothetical protein